MNYPCYFKEGFTPQSGIDTITIWLHPEIINHPQLFHERGSNNQGINLRYKKEMLHGTEKVIRTNFLVDIQAETINPNDDIFDQVLSILNYLTYSGILHRPRGRSIYDDLKCFFQTNFARLFALDRLDFYFDLRREDMRLLGEPNPDFPNTRYSSLHSSVLKAYLRDEKLRQKRHIAYGEIDNMDYPSRIEFSLCRDNCKYLNAYNLIGTYDYIFLRYLPFLARKWHDHRCKVVEVAERNIDYSHDLRQIITVAGRQIPQYTELLETPPKPIPYKNAGRNETDYNFIAEFYGRS